MDYSEARDAFFTPRPEPTPPLAWTTPARRLRDALEPIATICFWSEPASDAYASVGLDFLGGYVWGRACPLGAPDPGVVASAFGVFEPGLVTAVYDNARATCGVEDVRRAKQQGAVAALTQALGDPGEADGLGPTVAALRRAAEAAPAAGRPLFAGLRGLPWPEDHWGALWHAAGLLREHRGDAHLGAVVTAGLSGLEANILTERWVGWEPLAYTGTRAWSPEQMAEATSSLASRGLVEQSSLSAEGQRLREDLEARTDAAERSVVEALGADLDPVVRRLEGWSARVVEHGWFPPDPRKRSAG